MARQHRAAARLAYIPDIEPAPAWLLRRDARQFLNQINGFRVPPIAIAAQAHGLPGGSALGQGNRPCEAPLGIAAISRRAMLGRAALRTEKLFGMNTLHRRRDALAGQNARFLRLRFGLHATRKPEQKRTYDDDPTHVSLSPSAFTQRSRTRPIPKSKITGETPMRADPLSVVTRPMSAGAMNAVARPDNP